MKKRTRLKAIYFSSIEYMYTLPTEVYESAFSQTATDILTTSAERSFLEKLTILHREVYRAGTNRCLHVTPGIIMIYIVLENRNIKKAHFDNLIC